MLNFEVGGGGLLFFTLQESTPRIDRDIVYIVKIDDSLGWESSYICIYHPSDFIPQIASYIRLSYFIWSEIVYKTMIGTFYF